MPQTKAAAEEPHAMVPAPLPDSMAAPPPQKVQAEHPPTGTPFAARLRRTGDLVGRWGKGAHPAALNFGGCFACEVAKEHGCRLLWVGADFRQTDVEGAL